MLRNPHLTSPKGRGKMLRNPHPCLRRSRVRQAASPCLPCLRAGTGRPRGEVFARLGGFTWMDLSACVPHAQAGRMNRMVMG